MSKPFFSILLLVLIGTVVFLFNYNVTDAYIDSPDHLAVELRSPLDSAYTWKISNDVPFKYRMLFPKVVQIAWVAVRRSPHDNETFVVVYRGLCYLLFITSILTFSWLLRVVGFSTRQI